MQSIQEAGAIKDNFGLLSKDHKKVQTNQFMEFAGMRSKAQAARLLETQRASLYQKEFSLPEEFIKAKLIPIAMSADLAVELFKDLEKARLWMLAPNSYFFGQSPFDVCLVGNGKAVIEFLLSRLGRQSFAS